MSPDWRSGWRSAASLQVQSCCVCTHVCVRVRVCVRVVRVSRIVELARPLPAAALALADYSVLSRAVADCASDACTKGTAIAMGHVLWKSDQPYVTMILMTV